MGLLMWEKPKRARSKADHAEISFEDGPAGGYLPNMSEDDANAWKAKITGTKLGYPQVEIRKQAGPALMTIIYNLGDGYNYKGYRAEIDERYAQDSFSKLWLVARGTFGKAMHIGMNGGAQMSAEEATQFPLVLEEARGMLTQMVKVPGERQHYAAWLGPQADAASVVKDIEELGGKVSLSLPEYNMVYFTAPSVLVEPVFNLGNILAIWLADRVSEMAMRVRDYRATPQQLAWNFEAGLMMHGSDGPGQPIIMKS